MSREFLPGCPGPRGVFKKFVQKKVRAHFPFPNWVCAPLCCKNLCGERKKPINIENFGGTPPGVRPVCPGDTSHLSRDMSSLSRGHSVPGTFCPGDILSL